MTSSPPQKDLVVLTADKNAQFAIRGILARYKALEFRPIESPVFLVHPEKDPGVFLHPDELTRPYIKSHAHALIVMDREGSGREELSRAEMEQQIESTLRKAGWGDRAAALVIDPELDVWVWSGSPHVEAELGWSGREPNLTTWLRDSGFLAGKSTKPSRPKEAMEAALRVSRMPRSSARYQALAENVGLSRCTDDAFVRLKEILVGWFPKKTLR